MTDLASSTIGRLLRSRADECGDKPFLVVDEAHRSFGEVYREAFRLAKGMIALGLERGNHVAVLMPNSIEAAIVFYAAHLAGAVAVPINARFKRRELRYIIAHSNARFLFTTQAVREHVDFVALVWDSLEGLGDASGDEPLALASAPGLRHVVVFGASPPSPALDGSGLGDAAGSVADEVLIARLEKGCPEDIAFLLYTSGTTALPKGCLLTHRAVVNSWTNYGRIIGLQPDTAIWSPCPFFHIGGLGPMTAALALKASFLSMTHFDPSAAITMLLRHRPRHLFPAFPTLTLALLRSESYRPEQFDFVDTVLNVSPPDTQKLIQGLLPKRARLLNDFGMTEASGVVSLTRPEDEESQRLASNGAAMPGLEISIVDPVSKRELAQGQWGEIRFRGVNAFAGYYNDPEATAATIDREGWVSTADLGVIDAQGNLRFIGRLKEILKVGGENVAPAEVEAYLSTHPAIKMVQIVGRPDEKYGEVPVAFVELLEGSQIRATEIIDFCRGHLASFKVPREVRFVTEWPMSATKIQKFRLRELLDRSAD